jgi:hypothetical protein
VTGPEHYRAAEDALRDAEVAIGQYEDGIHPSKAAIAATLTQVAMAHAALATVAQTFEAFSAEPDEVGYDVRAAWVNALSLGGAR